MSRVEEQTKNFVELCKGNSVANVMRALRAVSLSVKEVLKTKYGTSDLEEIALRISMG